MRLNLENKETVVGILNQLGSGLWKFLGYWNPSYVKAVGLLNSLTTAPSFTMTQAIFFSYEYASVATVCMLLESNTI